MTVQTSAADFRRAVTIASKVVERRNCIPILDALRCHANGSFEVTGTDLDTVLSVSVPRTPGKDADFMMTSPRSVLSAVGAAGGTDVRIDSANGKGALTSGALKIGFGTLPSDDFPSDLGRPISEDFKATLSREDVASLGRVAKAMSTEETRYYLNGLHLKMIASTTLRAEATDGHRLYYVDIVLPDADGKLGDNVIIPRKVVGMLIDMARQADRITLAIGPTARLNSVQTTAPERAGAPRLAVTMTLGNADARLSSKLIDGTFPDVGRVIPAGGNTQMLFKSVELQRALAAISGHTREIRATKIVLGAPGKATISAAYVSMDLSVAVEVECQHSTPGFSIGYNGGYLQSALAAAGGSEVLFDVAGGDAPALIRNPADTAWTAILMPMRVD